MKNTRLSKHFMLAEFLNHDNLFARTASAQAGQYA